MGGGLMGMYSMFTGGGFEKCAVGSLGIMPYISATIVLQLLQAVIPSLSKLAREEGGRAKLIQRGRYLTVGLCLIQGLVMAISWEHPQPMFSADFNGRRLVAGSIHAIWWYRHSNHPHPDHRHHSLCGWANRSPTAASATAFP